MKKKYLLLTMTLNVIWSASCPHDCYCAGTCLDPALFLAAGTAGGIGASAIANANCTLGGTLVCVAVGSTALTCWRRDCQDNGYICGNRTPRVRPTIGSELEAGPLSTGTVPRGTMLGASIELATDSPLRGLASSTAIPPAPTQQAMPGAVIALPEESMSCRSQIPPEHIGAGLGVVLTAPVQHPAIETDPIVGLGGLLEVCNLHLHINELLQKAQELLTVARAEHKAAMLSRNLVWTEYTRRQENQTIGDAAERTNLGIQFIITTATLYESNAKLENAEKNLELINALRTRLGEAGIGNHRINDLRHEYDQTLLALRAEASIMEANIAQIRRKQDSYISEFYTEPYQPDPEQDHE